MYFVEDKKGESPEDPMLVELPFFLKFLNFLKPFFKGKNFAVK